MGMFDSFYDKDGLEWQTKAFGRNLSRWDIGDLVSAAPIDHQVMVLGGHTRHKGSRDAYATIRNCRLEAVPTERDETLPLLGYTGRWIPVPEGDAP